MAPRKRRRENTCAAAPETPIAWTLPSDLMLDIVARSEPATIFRFAAACKLLRRDILSPSFIRRVSHQAAPCILASLNIYKPPSLVHPHTAVAASFCRDHLWRLMARRARTLLDNYEPVASRRGLVLFNRREDTIEDEPPKPKSKRRGNKWSRPPKSKRCSDMCVYDLMSGARTFLSRPPGIETNEDFGHEYVLLTEADGIGCSFLLLVADFYGRSIKVQVASSRGTWGPVTYVKEDGEFLWTFVTRNHSPAVLIGGVIHWASCVNKYILSYNVGTGKTGSVKLPPTTRQVNTTRKANELLLTTSSDGELLKLINIEGFNISVWLQLPASAGGGGWALEAVINMEEKLQLIYPNFPPGNPKIVFQGSGKRTGDVVLLQIYKPDLRGIIVLDLETKDMHIQECDGRFLEIDLPSRLESMKIFF